MDIDNADISGRLSRAPGIFRRIATLFFIAFVIIVLWTAYSGVVLAISIYGATEDNSLLFTALPMLSIFILYSISFSLIPFLLYRMLRDISRQKKPFTTINSKRLFRMAIIMLIYAILERISLEVQSQFLFYIGSNKIHVGTFIYDFASHSGTSLNLFPLVIAAVFFALSYVFKYGVLLQQESDETL